ncbi:MAG: DUF1700 domain-containing protein [Clostridiales bacterium]|nr:DUF1700 domain-containing protein [Clostridiales bacterium]
MKAKKWLKLLKKNIKNTTYGEKQSIVWYYEEMINDKIESGEDEEKVVESLGNPNDIANKISEESGDGEQKNKTYKKRSYPIWAIIVLGFFGLTVGLPLFISWIAVIISFGAVAISGFAVAIGGIVALLGSIITAFFPFVDAKLALIGGAITMIGVGLILIGLFYYITKGMVYITKIFIKRLLKKGDEV